MNSEIDQDRIPVILNRSEWNDLLNAMKRHEGTTPQAIQYLTEQLQREGDPLVIDILPSGLKWAYSEVLRGKPLSEKLDWQHNFWVVHDPMKI